MIKQPTLTKADLIEEVLKVTELPRKESEIIVETIFDSIIEAIQKGEKIEIRGFGSFRTRERRGRVGRNPKTGEKVEVPAKRIPFFKPSKELKDFVNSDEAAAMTAAAEAAAGRHAGFLQQCRRVLLADLREEIALEALGAQQHRDIHVR
jgi:integration host factor subunit beta